MNVEEFLEEYSKLPSNGWTAKICGKAIRLKPLGGNYFNCCPISAVCQELKGSSYNHVLEAGVASHKIGMFDTREVLNIIQAADGEGRFREALLKPFGLIEEEDHSV